MVNMPTDPDKEIASLRASLSEEEIGKAILLASDYPDLSLLVAASLHARLGLKRGIKGDIEESIRDWSKSFSDDERKTAVELGKKHGEPVLKLAALFAGQAETQTLLTTGTTAREVCSGCEDGGCQCHSDQLPRELPIYRAYVSGAAEILALCDPCRKRLEDAKEIRVAPAGVLPLEPPDFPPSAID